MNRYAYIKRPSKKEIREQKKKDAEIIKNYYENRYTKEEKERYKYGIFHKNGWVSYMCFETEEEANEHLANMRNKHYYCVRKILDWGD